jgi:hypothetical protein
MLGSCNEAINHSNNPCVDFPVHCSQEHIHPCRLQIRLGVREDSQHAHSSHPHLQPAAECQPKKRYVHKADFIWRGVGIGPQRWAALLCRLLTPSAQQKRSTAAAALLNDAPLMLTCGSTQHSSAVVEDYRQSSQLFLGLLRACTVQIAP